MQPIQLFDLASQQARWLATRQATVAQNVSNANTPGFRALDVRPFAEVLARVDVPMATTDAAHIGTISADAGSLSTKPADAWEITHTGNSVGLEQELMKAGDINRSFSLNTGIVKAFHGMLMSSVKAAA